MLDEEKFPYALDVKIPKRSPKTIRTIDEIFGSMRRATKFYCKEGEYEWVTGTGNLTIRVADQFTLTRLAIVNDAALQGEHFYKRRPAPVVQ
ncbi:MAG: hypothetical protein PW843_21400 [Azospirillaceae bacterium]|nr:hypothetical protein [Azospirillaceae bacterium]